MQLFLSFQVQFSYHWMKKQEHPWKVYHFEHVPQRFYKNEENVKRVLGELARELKVEKFEDWYGVSHSQIAALGYISILHECRGCASIFFLINEGIFELLSKFYPEFNWEKTRFRFYKSQQFLYQALSDLFPKAEVFMNYPHPDIRFENGNRVELDIFVPAFSIAFEYQGEVFLCVYSCNLQRHFFDNTLHGVTSETKLRDSEKAKLCAQHGITLIQIPYWWNFSNDSLKATIHKYRPDIIQESQLSEGSTPIPENIEFSHSKKTQIK